MQSVLAKKIGPYGGPGGNSWDIQYAHQPKKLVSITIWSDDHCNDGCGDGAINGLSFNYVDWLDNDFLSGPWGTQTGKRHMIYIIEGEDLIKVSGTTNGNHITSLNFVTNKKTYGPYGRADSTSDFSIQGTIVAFLGRSSEKLNAIGAYSLPFRP